MTLSSLIRTVAILATLTSPAVAFDSALAALPTAVNGQPLPSLSDMLEKVTPSVVNITTEGSQRSNDALLNDPFFKRFFGDVLPGDRPISGTGSGVIIHAQRGHILTNHHVIDGADNILITLTDGRKFQAEIVGIDPKADLAILQIPPDRLVAMRFGDSDRLRVGDFVVAIGNPYSIGQTVTSGIISALHRNPGISEYENFIQTDAPINLGNSGGPLVNLRGELIGINTAILGDQGGGNLGIGFAIPINTAAGVINQIVQFGKVERGQLGIEVGDMTESLAKNAGIPPNGGAVVVSLLPGSAAEQAGLLPGDIITRLNGRIVSNAVDVKNMVGDLRTGSKVHMTLLRGGRPRNVTVIIGSTPTAALGQNISDRPYWERRF